MTVMKRNLSLLICILIINHSFAQNVGIGTTTPLTKLHVEGTASNIATFASKFKIAYPVYVSGLSGTDLSRHFGNATGGLPSAKFWRLS